MKNLFISIKNLILEFFHLCLDQMGFDSIADLGKSLFNFELLLYSSNIILVMSMLSKFSVEYLGLAGIISSAFALLIILQFATGVWVSLKTPKNKIEERKILRILIRLTIYGLLMFIMNAFTHFPPIDLMGINLNIWDYLYHFSIALIIFQLLVSTAKNLSKLGFDEMKLFGEFIGRKLNALIELDKNNTKQFSKKDNDADKKI